MKKILQPQQDEEVVYYSDFSGRLFRDLVPVTVKIDCNYGSSYDGGQIEFHLSDVGLEMLLDFFKKHICIEKKEELKRCLNEKPEYKELYEKLI
jgi:hypothetical protein